MNSFNEAVNLSPPGPQLSLFYSDRLAWKDRDLRYRARRGDKSRPRRGIRERLRARIDRLRGLSPKIKPPGSPEHSSPELSNEQQEEESFGFLPGGLPQLVMLPWVSKEVEDVSDLSSYLSIYPVIYIP